MKLKRSEYHQLVGLLVLASRHQRALDEILEAVGDVVKEPHDRLRDGHCSDAVYSGYTADELLRKLAAERKAKK